MEARILLSGFKDTGSILVGVATLLTAAGRRDRQGHASVMTALPAVHTHLACTAPWNFSTASDGERGGGREAGPDSGVHERPGSPLGALLLGSIFEVP